MSESKKILQDAVKQLAKSEHWLKRSYQQCATISFEKGLSPEEFDKVENLASRFARSVDILTNKVFRAVDALELVTGGTLIDTINRAAKRNIIKSEQQLRQMKETRNSIVHEYTEEKLIGLMLKIVQFTPALLADIAATQTYCEKALKK